MHPYLVIFLIWVWHTFMLYNKKRHIINLYTKDYFITVQKKKKKELRTGEGEHPY